MISAKLRDLQLKGIFSESIASFRQVDNSPPLQNEPLKSPPRLGLIYK